MFPSELFLPILVNTIETKRLNNTDATETRVVTKIDKIVETPLPLPRIWRLVYEM